MTKKIEHTGIIQAVLPNKVIVRIEQVSACAGCHAKNACTMADKADKTIEIENPKESFIVNEPVLVSVESSMGLLAVWYAFGLPLLLMFAVLFLSRTYLTEAYSILAVLGTLIIYYVIVYFFRNKLKTRFEFQLKKQINSVEN